MWTSERYLNLLQSTYASTTFQPIVVPDEAFQTFAEMKEDELVDMYQSDTASRYSPNLSQRLHSRNVLGNCYQYAAIWLIQHALDVILEYEYDEALRDSIKELQPLFNHINMYDVDVKYIEEMFEDDNRVFFQLEEIVDEFMVLQWAFRYEDLETEDNLYIVPGNIIEVVPGTYPPVVRVSYEYPVTRVRVEEEVEMEEFFKGGFAHEYLRAIFKTMCDSIPALGRWQVMALERDLDDDLNDTGSTPTFEALVGQLWQLPKHFLSTWMEYEDEDGEPMVGVEDVASRPARGHIGDNSILTDSWIIDKESLEEEYPLDKYVANYIWETHGVEQDECTILNVYVSRSAFVPSSTPAL